eukprot:gene6194-7426_t
MDYLIDLMHLIKNLGEHVCDSLIGADFDDNKVRQWVKQEGIKANWWACTYAYRARAKKLKAHEYLVMFVSGTFATLAAWPRDDNSPNPLVMIVGDLTTIIRELTSSKIIPKVRY